MTERLPFHFSLSCIGEGDGNPLQCSCLENPRDRGAWWAAVYGVAQSRTRLKRPSSSSPCSSRIFTLKSQVTCLRGLQGGTLGPSVSEPPRWHKSNSWGGGGGSCVFLLMFFKQKGYHIFFLWGNSLGGEMKPVKYADAS